MPGVSRNTTCASGRVSTPWIEVRVVCGLSATMAIFAPTSAFNSVDLPALGRPRIETKPDTNPGAEPSASLIRYRRFGLAHTHLRYPQFIPRRHFDADAVAVHKLAALRNAPQPLGNQAAHRRRFNFFLRTESQQIA